jgi:hypothetical protein
VYVKNLVNLGYDLLSNSSWQGGYADYLAAKANRGEGVVAVGANAGIFHLFQGSTGKEVFGFLPRQGFGHYATVAEKTYGSDSNYHRFFVDGPTVESDAFIQPRGEWCTLDQCADRQHGRWRTGHLCPAPAHGGPLRRAGGRQRAMGTFRASGPGLRDRRHPRRSDPGRNAVGSLRLVRFRRQRRHQQRRRRAAGG